MAASKKSSTRKTPPKKKAARKRPSARAESTAKVAKPKKRAGTKAGAQAETAGKATAPAKKKAAGKAKAGGTAKAAGKKATKTGTPASAVTLGHVFALRPRVNTSFRPPDFARAKRELVDERFDSVEHAARSVAERALELTRESAVRPQFKKRS